MEIGLDQAMRGITLQPLYHHRNFHLGPWRNDEVRWDAVEGPDCTVMLFFFFLPAQWSYFSEVLELWGGARQSLKWLFTLFYFIKTELYGLFSLAHDCTRIETCDFDHLVCFYSVLTTQYQMGKMFKKVVQCQRGKIQENGHNGKGIKIWKLWFF